MRLPWLQVDQDGLTRCRLLARLLGVPDTQGIGIGMALWQWALEIAPEGDFRGLVPDPGILAAAVGWPVADAARLISELQRVGMVATTPQLRVRGLDRYIRAWEKNSGRKAIYRNSGDGVPETGANPARIAPEPARQTQIQIHTQKKKKEACAGDTPPVVELREAWNSTVTAPIPKWQEGRTGIALKALERRPLDEWREVFRRIQASAFCRGSTGWRADIDWALRAGGTKPEPALKVLEGAYDDRSTGPPRDTRAPVAAESIDWSQQQAGEIL